MTLAERLLAGLTALADPDRAASQRAYMKSSMPYLGVPMPEVRRVCREVFRSASLAEADQWRAAILAVWRTADYREQRYCAIELAGHRAYRRWLTPDAMPMLDELIVSGAWWDYVDALSQLVGRVLEAYPQPTKPVLRRWAVDENMWRRRTAILAQLKFKGRTDETLLFEAVDANRDDAEFFVRKAIGWALREYSKTNPQAVLRYLAAGGAALSPLSRREALKVLRKRGLAP